MSKSYEVMAAEVVAKHGRYCGDKIPTFDYYIRFEGETFFANDTHELTLKVAKKMRQSSRSTFRRTS